jgi:PKD repeat protein
MKSIKFSFGKILFLFVAMALITSCDEELPDVGSIADETPPEAGFSYVPNDGDWKQIDFANLSISATDYAWDFGDGGTSTDKNPSHAYDTSGTFTVSLTSSDKLNATSTITQSVEVVVPVIVFTPEILNPGFEDGTDNWLHTALDRTGSFGGPQITSSPVNTGAKAGKFPTSNERHAYQLITVQPNTDYILFFYYTMKTSPVGNLTVSLLAGDVTDRAAIAAATIGTTTVNDQTDASTYIREEIQFNSGANTEVAIYMENMDVEARVDDLNIVEN